MKVSYFICGRQFFSGLPTGKTAHAKGVIEGLSLNGHEVTLVSFDAPPDLTHHAKVSTLQFQNIFSAIYSFHKSFVSERKSADLVIVRKNWFFVIYLFFIRALLGQSFGKAKTVIEVNGFYDRFEGYSPARLIHFTYNFLVRYTLNSFDYIYVVSEELKHRIARARVRVPIKVINNGSPFVERFDLCKKGEKSALIFFGNLRRYNDFDLLGRISDDFDKVVIYGHGECEREVVALSKVKRNCHFEGAISFESLHDLIQESEYRFFGICPIKPEIDNMILSPIKLYEYLALGMPVLVPEMSIRAEEADCIIKYSNESDLRKATQKIRSLDYQRLSKEARGLGALNSWQSRMRDLISWVHD